MPLCVHAWVAEGGGRRGQGPKKPPESLDVHALSPVAVAATFPGQKLMKEEG